MFCLPPPSCFLGASWLPPGCLVRARESPRDPTGGTGRAGRMFLSKVSAGAFVHLTAGRSGHRAASCSRNFAPLPSFDAMRTLKRSPLSGNKNSKRKNKIKCFPRARQSPRPQEPTRARESPREPAEPTRAARARESHESPRETVRARESPREPTRIPT